MRQVQLTVALCMVLAALSSGCVNRKVVADAAQQSIDNNKLLLQEQARTSHLFEITLQQNQALARQLAELVGSECTRTNQNIASYVQARKSAEALRIKTRFDDTAFAALTGFADVFNDRYAGLRAKYTELEKELSQFPNDLSHATDIANKKFEMTGVAYREARDYALQREAQVTKIAAERATLFATIDAQIGAIQGPAEDCKTITAEWSAAAAALDGEAKSASDYEAKVAALYDEQSRLLGVIREYANRLTVGQLVIKGASEELTGKIQGLTERVTNLFAVAGARVDTLLGRAQNGLVTGFNDFNTRLEQASGSLESRTNEVVHGIQNFIDSQSPPSATGPRPATLTSTR